MCIILIKEKGIDVPSKKQLKVCHEKNKDGAGIMLRRNGTKRIILKKGFTSLKRVIGS